MLDKVVITRFITCLLFVRTFVVHFCRAPRCTSVAGDRPMREIVFGQLLGGSVALVQPSMCMWLGLATVLVVLMWMVVPVFSNGGGVFGCSYCLQPW